MSTRECKKIIKYLKVKTKVIYAIIFLSVDYINHVHNLFRIEYTQIYFYIEEVVLIVFFLEMNSNYI